MKTPEKESKMKTLEKGEKWKQPRKVGNETLKKVKNEKPCWVLLGGKQEFLSFNTKKIKS